MLKARASAARLAEKASAAAKPYMAAVKQSAGEAIRSGNYKTFFSTMREKRQAISLAKHGPITPGARKRMGMNRVQARNHAATEIQRIVRGLVVRRAVERIRRDRIYEERMIAAVILQRFARLFVQRRAFRHDIIRRIEAAVMIQRMWRGVKTFRNIRVERKRKSNAMRIQRWFRNWRFRRTLKVLYLRRSVIPLGALRYAALRAIRKMIIEWRFRRMVRMAVEYNNRYKLAVVVVQRAMRRWIGRLEYLRMRDQMRLEVRLHAAAVPIQKMIRAFLRRARGRHGREKLRDAAFIICRYGRGFLARQEVKRRRALRMNGWEVVAPSIPLSFLRKILKEQRAADTLVALKGQRKTNVKVNVDEKALQRWFEKSRYARKAEEGTIHLHDEFGGEGESGLLEDTPEYLRIKAHVDKLEAAFQKADRDKSGLLPRPVFSRVLEQSGFKSSANFIIKLQNAFIGIGDRVNWKRYIQFARRLRRICSIHKVLVCPACLFLGPCTECKCRHFRLDPYFTDQLVYIFHKQCKCGHHEGRHTPAMRIQPEFPLPPAESLVMQMTAPKASTRTKNLSGMNQGHFDAKVAYEAFRTLPPTVHVPLIDEALIGSSDVHGKMLKDLEDQEKERQAMVERIIKEEEEKNKQAKKEADDPDFEYYDEVIPGTEWATDLALAPPSSKAKAPEPPVSKWAKPFKTAEKALAANAATTTQGKRALSPGGSSVGSAGTMGSQGSQGSVMKRGPKVVRRKRRKPRPPPPSVSMFGDKGWQKIDELLNDIDDVNHNIDLDTGFNRRAAFGATGGSFGLPIGFAPTVTGSLYQGTHDMSIASLGPADLYQQYGYGYTGMGADYMERKWEDEMNRLDRERGMHQNGGYISPSGSRSLSPMPSRGRFGSLSSLSDAGSPTAGEKQMPPQSPLPTKKKSAVISFEEAAREVNKIIPKEERDAEAAKYLKKNPGDLSWKKVLVPKNLWLMARSGAGNIPEEDKTIAKRMVKYLVMLRVSAAPGPDGDIIGDDRLMTDFFLRNWDVLTQYWQDLVDDVRFGTVRGGPRGLSEKQRIHLQTLMPEPDDGRANMLESVFMSMFVRKYTDIHELPLSKIHPQNASGTPVEKNWNVTKEPMGISTKSAYLTPLPKVGYTPQSGSLEEAARKEWKKAYETSAFMNSGAAGERKAKARGEAKAAKAASDLAASRQKLPFLQNAQSMLRLVPLRPDETAAILNQDPSSAGPGASFVDGSGRVVDSGGNQLNDEYGNPLYQSATDVPEGGVGVGDSFVMYGITRPGSRSGMGSRGGQLLPLPAAARTAVVPGTKNPIMSASQYSQSGVAAPHNQVQLEPLGNSVFARFRRDQAREAARKKDSQRLLVGTPHLVQTNIFAVEQFKRKGRSPPPSPRQSIFGETNFSESVISGYTGSLADPLVHASVSTSPGGSMQLGGQPPQELGPAKPEPSLYPYEWRDVLREKITSYSGSTEVCGCPYPGCGKRFTSEILVHDHIRMVHGDKPVIKSVSGVDHYLTGIWETTGVRNMMGLNPDHTQRAPGKRPKNTAVVPGRPHGIPTLASGKK
jgi:hypothetical protein